MFGSKRFSKKRRILEQQGLELNGECGISAVHDRIFLVRTRQLEGKLQRELPDAGIYRGAGDDAERGRREIAVRVRKTADGSVHYKTQRGIEDCFSQRAISTPAPLRRRDPGLLVRDHLRALSRCSQTRFLRHQLRSLARQ